MSLQCFWPSKNAFLNAEQDLIEKDIINWAFSCYCGIFAKVPRKYEVEIQESNHRQKSPRKKFMKAFLSLVAPGW